MASENRARTDAKQSRGPGRPFQPGNQAGRRWRPGESGNPSGRPRSCAEVRELAAARAERAIERLAELIESRDGSLAISAAKVLLDRGFGRPTDGQLIETEQAQAMQSGVAAMSGAELAKTLQDGLRRLSRCAASVED